jgi:hypothetical protein
VYDWLELRATPARVSGDFDSGEEVLACTEASCWQDLTEAKDMMSRGLYLVLSGDSLDAGQAQQAGLTIKVVPPGLRPILRARASRVLRGKGRQARDGGVF